MANFPDVTSKNLRRRAGAEAAIRREGQTMTLVRVEDKGVEWAPFRLSSETEIVAVDLNERIRDAQGTLTGETRRKLIVSTSAGVTPAKGDKVKIGTVQHEVTEVRPLAPGGTTILFEVDLAG